MATRWEELAEAAEAVAVTARVEARAMEAHRAALGRYALVWWQGGAAERYQQLVQERVNELAGVGRGARPPGDGCGRLLAERAAVAAVGAAHAGRAVMRWRRLRRAGERAVGGAGGDGGAGRGAWPTRCAGTRTGSPRCRRGCDHRPCGAPGDAALFAQWVRLEAETTRVVGPTGMWGQALALDALALHLRAAARGVRRGGGVGGGGAGRGGGRGRPRGARWLAHRRQLDAGRQRARADPGARPRPRLPGCRRPGRRGGGARRRPGPRGRGGPR